MESNFEYPILYTFRRCPYAMRARFAIRASKIKIEVREIKLQDKPSEFLKSSPKGTVPVLITKSGQVLEESLDIMNWALNINDPEKWLSKGELQEREVKNLLDELEIKFKTNLDKYKYPSRFSEIDPHFHRDKNFCFPYLGVSFIKDYKIFKEILTISKEKSGEVEFFKKYSIRSSHQKRGTSISPEKVWYSHYGGFDYYCFSNNLNTNLG